MIVDTTTMGGAMSINMIKRLFGYCPTCNRYFVYPKTREINTRYVDEADNVWYSCYKCYTVVSNCVEEAWRGYNNERL